MKKALGLFLLYLAVGFAAFGQNTTVSGTIVDSDGTTWANGSWNATLINPNGGNVFYCNSTTPVQTRWPLTGSSPLDGSGHFSQVMADNTQVCPSGTSWQFTFASNTSAAASQIPSLSISGATFSISTYATANIKAPRIQASPTAYAYTDGEIFPVPTPGGYYFNVTSQQGRQWNGSAWQGFVYNSWNGGTVTNPINYPGGNIGSYDYVPFGYNNIENTNFAGGAKCDGTTDDTAAIQAAFNASLTNDMPVYIPPSIAGCLVTKSIDGGTSTPGGRNIVVEGRPQPMDVFSAFGSKLLDELTEAYPVLDFVGNQGTYLRNFAIYTPFGFGSSQSYGGFLCEPTGSTGDGVNCRVEHVFAYSGSHTGGAACAIIDEDLSGITDMRCWGNYVGLVLGDGPGTTSIPSKFHSIGTSSSVTHVWIDKSIVQSTLDNPLELTGSDGYYGIDNSYIVLVGAGTVNNLSIISMLPKGTEGGCITGKNWRTENQTSGPNASNVSPLNTGPNGCTGANFDADLDASSTGSPSVVIGKGFFNSPNIHFTTNLATAFTLTGSNNGIRQSQLSLTLPAGTGDSFGTMFWLDGNKITVNGPNNASFYQTLESGASIADSNKLCSLGYFTAGVYGVSCADDNLYTVGGLIQVPNVSSAATSNTIAIAGMNVAPYYYNTGAGSTLDYLYWGWSTASQPEPEWDFPYSQETRTVLIKAGTHDILQLPSTQQIISSTLLCQSDGTNCPARNPIRAGTWSISSATSVAITFGTPISSTPSSCSVTPSSTASTTGTPFVTSLATTGFTVNVPVSGSISGTYQCVLNNTN